MDLKRLLPELQLISDHNLARKVAQVWETAILRAKLSESNLHVFPFAAHELDRCHITLIDHTRYVVKTAFQISRDLNDWYGQFGKIDSDVLLAGSILHDVGKLIEYERCGDWYHQSEIGKFLRHPALGAMIAFEHEIPVPVIHIIERHSFEGDKQFLSPECLVVRHADSLHFLYSAIYFSNK